MAQLHDLTALEQAAAVRAGDVSATELAEHYLRRIAEYGDTVGAFVTVTGDAARAAARTADELTRTSAVEDLPPLHGVPIGIKDLTMTAGVRTTFGSAAFADFVPPMDADVVALLRAAGTISLGKTTTSEFGLSLYSETEVAPPARNPWSLEHTAGGSSGGAAAAVAARLLPFAQGNDGGGSVRIPAAICGLVGFKPSRGLVSNGPIGFGGFGLSTNGPIGRTVADVAALLDAMAVPMPGEPYPSPPRPAGGFLRAVTGAGPGPLRIGRFTAAMLADAPLDPACVAAVDIASAALTDAGHQIVDIPGLLDPTTVDQFETMWAALSLTAVIPRDAEPKLLPLTRWMRARGAELSAATLLADLATVQHDIRRALRTLAPYDLLLCPTLAAPQAPIGYFAGADDPAEDFARQKRFSPYCAAYNVTGQPAVSMPVGRTDDGLPVGAMLAGAVGADALVLAVAAQVEQVMPKPDRHPAMWAG
jgi:amidase